MKTCLCYLGPGCTSWWEMTPYAHGDFFVGKGEWVHVWYKYHDRDHHRIRCELPPDSACWLRFERKA